VVLDIMSPEYLMQLCFCVTFYGVDKDKGVNNEGVF
jgi:hypothetical protein